MTNERSFEVEARAEGWMTEQEMHGVDDNHGVVHPDGWWAPDWQLACNGFGERRQFTKQGF